MTNFINASSINSNDWLAVVTTEGPTWKGEVLGYAVLGFAIGETEQQVSNIPLGELCDALELFIGEDIPDEVSVEYFTYEEFWNSYGDRMPLGNNGFRI